MLSGADRPAGLCEKLCGEGVYPFRADQFRTSRLVFVLSDTAVRGGTT